MKDTSNKWEIEIKNRNDKRRKKNVKHKQEVKDRSDKQEKQKQKVGDTSEMWEIKVKNKRCTWET